MIDFHCHLDLYKNYDRVIEKCNNKSMYVLAVTTTPSAWEGTNNLVKETKRIRAALGLHPQIAHERINELNLFDKYLPETNYVGEIGLDGSNGLRPYFDTQLTAFKHILNRCSEEGGKILSIHSRNASKEVMDELLNFPEAGTPILHWFSGNDTDLDRAINHGCWFSVGPMMFKSKNGRLIIDKLPKDKVLTETDGPFAQINGKALMPWQVSLAIQGLSEIWQVPIQKVTKILHGNLSRLLNQKIKE